jgi:hypothetical protein
MNKEAGALANKVIGDKLRQCRMQSAKEGILGYQFDFCILQFAF